MQVDFNAAKQISYDGDGIVEVHFKGIKIWPIGRQEFSNQFTDGYKGTNIRYTVEQGAIVRTYGPTTSHDQGSWIDMGIALFKMVGGTLVPVTDLSIAPQDGNWWLQGGTLDYNAIAAPGVVQSNSLNALDGVWDTSHMPPGEYHILSGGFSDFDPKTTQFIIDVKPSLIPAPIVIQLPDDPWTGAPIQTINVRKGQTITFKYPKNPQSVNNEPTTMGWRHLNFAYIDKGQTHEAAFPVTGSVPQIDAIGEASSYNAIRFMLLGNALATEGGAFNIGQWALKKQDVVVTVRGDATIQDVYVMSYNGNWANTPGPLQHNWDGPGILYKLHITDVTP